MWSFASSVVSLTFLALCSATPVDQKCPEIPEAGLGVTNKDGVPLALTNPRESIVEEIRDGLYWTTDGVYTNMFLVGESGVLLVDAPPNLMGATPNLVETIKSVTDKPLTHLVLTHFHKDHIGASVKVIDSCGGDVTVIAHEDTKQLLEEAREVDPDDPRPLVGITFKEKALIFPSGLMAIDGEAEEPEGFAGLVLTPDNFHSEGDLYVYAPAHKTLNVVDLIFPGHIPFARFAIARDVRRFTRAHDTVLSFDFETLVAGHVNRLATREDVETQKALVDSIQKAAGEALAAPPQGTPNTDECFLLNTWKAFDAFLGPVIDSCVAAVKEEWEGKLVMVDSFLAQHCDVMQTALRVD